jgi:hypothetical protein
LAQAGTRSSIPCAPSRLRTHPLHTRRQPPTRQPRWSRRHSSGAQRPRDASAHDVRLGECRSTRRAIGRASHSAPEPTPRGRSRRTDSRSRRLGSNTSNPKVLAHSRGRRPPRRTQAPHRRIPDDPGRSLGGPDGRRSLSDPGNPDDPRSPDGPRNLNGPRSRRVPHLRHARPRRRRRRWALQPQRPEPSWWPRSPRTSSTTIASSKSSPSSLYLHS